jgi:Formin Homology 2 Domain
LDSLNKLSDVKATGGQETILHYVVKLVQQKYKECEDLAADFPNITQASRESLAETKKSLAKLKADFAFVEQQLKNPNLQAGKFKVGERRLHAF